MTRAKKHNSYESHQLRCFYLHVYFLLQYRKGEGDYVLQTRISDSNYKRVCANLLGADKVDADKAVRLLRVSVSVTSCIFLLLQSQP